jgi:hypothetical protein
MCRSVADSLWWRSMSIPHDRRQDAARLLELLEALRQPEAAGRPSTTTIEFSSKPDAVVSVTRRQAPRPRLLGKPVLVLRDAFYSSRRW